MVGAYTIEIRKSRWLTISMMHVAFAGGFMLALCCDFRLMTDGKAWACMNEVRPLSIHDQKPPLR